MVDYFFINEKLLWSGLIRVWSDIFFNIGMTKWQKNFGFLQFLFSKSHQFLWGWSVIRVWSDIFFRIFSTMVVYTGTVLYSERESTLCGVVYLSFDFVLKSNVSIVAVF